MSSKENMPGSSSAFTSFYRRMLATKTRYRQAADSARFQVTLLSDRDARGQTFLSADGWRQSKIVQWIRKHPGLTRSAYRFDVKVVRPLGTRLNVGLSLLYPSISALLTLLYYVRKAKARDPNAIELIRAKSGLGRYPVLLFTPQQLCIPELARVASELAEDTSYTDKVAMIVPNGTIEAALKPIAGRAAFFSMQQFWLDQSIDIANHELVNSALALREAAPADRKQHVGLECEPGVDLFEAMYMDLHIEFVQMLRLGRAIKAALDAGKTTIVVCLSLPDDQLWFYEDFVSSDLRSRIVSLVAMDPSNSQLLKEIKPRPSSEEMIERARARVAGVAASESDDEGTQLARTGERDPRSVAIICDAAAGSHFWPTVLNLATLAKEDKRGAPILVESPFSAQALRDEGFAVSEFPVIAATEISARFARAYTGLIDELSALNSSNRKVSDPLSAAMQRHIIARLANSDDSYTLILNNYQVRIQIEKWLLDHRIGSVVVVPHWGKLAWAGVAAARGLDIPAASTPAVSVAGNSASIVAWNHLDLIGCYGLQCRDAFLALGYAPGQLQLTGSIPLDQTIQLTREKARERLKTYEAMAAGNRQIVLYATSGVNKDESDILAKIVEFCSASNGRVVLIIRPHHSIGRNKYDMALSAIPEALKDGIVTISSEGSAQVSIAASDVVITDFSTIGAEAVLIGRPLLAVNTSGAPFAANNYADLGVAVQASSLDEIGPLLQRLLAEGAFWPNAGESLKKFTDAYNWGSDGQAGRRLLTALDELADRAQARLQKRIAEQGLLTPAKTGSSRGSDVPARLATPDNETSASDVMKQSQDLPMPAGQVRRIDGASAASEDLSAFAVHRDTSLRDTIALIDRNGSGIAVVIDEATRLLDVVTDGDIRRAILGGIDLTEPVSRVVDAKTADGKTHKPVTGRIEDPPEFLLMLMERLVLHQLPLLDRDGRVKRIVHRDALSARPQVKSGTRAVIMAGGFGTRLRPLTERVPKPMLKVAGRPILEHTVRRLVLAGFEQIFISLYYLPEVITGHFGDGSRFGTRIDYIRESKPLGTAGAVSLADHGDQPMLIMNGDVMTDLNYVGLLDFHHSTGAAITMAGAPYEVGVPYGVAAIDDTNNVTGLQEKPIQRFYINTGIYVASPAALGLIPTDTVYNMTDLVEQAIKSGMPAKLYAMHEYWRDIGRIEDLQRANLEMGQERTIR